MNAIFLAAALFTVGAQDVQTTPQPTTQLYVKTVPPGAAVTVDGKLLGKSDSLFNATPGPHKLMLQMEGYVQEDRAIEVRDGEITRVEVDLKKQSGKEVVLSYVGDSSDGQRSFADSGHAVAFQRPAGMKSVIAVKLFAARYGLPEPPKEDFHIYLLDDNQKVLEQIAVPYSRIERGDLRWYTFDFPAVEVPEKFFVAVWFNAEATKGVYLGMKKDVKETHSYVGLPDKGFRKADESFDWMIRAVASSDSGKQPTHPKVTTYETEKAADTENTEAQPVVDQSSKPETRGPKKDAAKPGAAEARELSHDNGTLANKSSIAGGGHAVKFKVDGDSYYVTSVSLHGSRYGMPQAPKEDFNVWICDAQFKPIATFHFPYGSFTRADPVWKSFRIRPTRVPEEFIVCFGFNPEATKGVYVSYDSQASETSMVGVPGQGEPKPFAKGNWLIRCKVEKRAEKGAKTE